MARVEKLNKRKAAISAMVESIINGQSADAEEHLHDYLQILSKELILGEGDDSDDEDDEKKSDDEDDDDDDDDEEMEARSKKSDDEDDDDDDDEDDVKEGFNQPSEGKMSKKVVPQSKSKGSAKAEKHGNAAPHLDDKVKGKAKYARFPGKGKMKKHDNVKDDYDKKCDGRDKNLGTTE